MNDNFWFLLGCQINQLANFAMDDGDLFSIRVKKLDSIWLLIFFILYYSSIWSVGLWSSSFNIHSFLSSFLSASGNFFLLFIIKGFSAYVLIMLKVLFLGVICSWLAISSWIPWIKLHYLPFLQVFGLVSE